MAILRLARWFAFALAGCYTVPSGRCALKCTTECPAAMTCGVDGFCHAANDDASCAVPSDAGPSCLGNLMPEGGVELWTGTNGAPTAVAGHASSFGVQVCSLDGGFTNAEVVALTGSPLEADASYALAAWMRTPSGDDAGLAANAKFQEFDGSTQLGTAASADSPLGDAWTKVSTSYVTAGGKHVDTVFVLKNQFAGACFQVSDVCLQRTP